MNGRTISTKQSELLKLSESEFQKFGHIGSSYLTRTRDPEIRQRIKTEGTREWALYQCLSIMNTDFTDEKCDMLIKILNDFSEIDKAKLGNLKMEQKWVSLEGTAKQIEWAEQIRSEKMQCLNEDAQKIAGQIPSSKFWIDYRLYNADCLVGIINGNYGHIYNN